MSRSGYTDDIDSWSLIRWRGAVNSAIKGSRGQVFLKELLTALDDMPEKKLIANELHDSGGCCTIGAIGISRGVDMSVIDPDDPDQVSSEFNIANALAQEIVFLNDECGWYNETPEQRWVRMRNWVAEQINH